jgi:tight adherence protein B
MTPIVISILVFAGVTGLIGAATFLFRSKPPAAEDRLAAFTGQKKETDSSSAVEIWKKEAFEGEKKSFMERVMPNLPSLDRIMQQADCHIKPSTLLSASIILCVSGTSVSWFLGAPLFVLPLPALILFSLPWMWLLHKRKRRLKKFAAQLPDALELVARALRAGHSLAAGMHVVAEEMPEPIASEFCRVYEEQNLGISLEDALKGLVERVPNLDLKFFVTSVAIQRQTGGDLAEILDKIGHVVRERYRILGQVMALTGEGRLSGVVLIALPFVLFFVVLHLNPKYVELLWKTEIGIKMSVTALVMQILGALVIRKIVNIKV